MSASRLATVLRVRRLQEDAARAEVGRAQAQALAADERARTQEQGVRALPAPAAAPTAEFLAGLASGLHRARDAGFARTTAGEAAGVVVERLAGWQEAATRVRPLETAVQAQREAAQAEAQRREQAAGDDLAGAAWQRAQIWKESS